MQFLKLTLILWYNHFFKVKKSLGSLHEEHFEKMSLMSLTSTWGFSVNMVI